MTYYQVQTAYTQPTVPQHTLKKSMTGLKWELHCFMVFIATKTSYLTRKEPQRGSTHLIFCFHSIESKGTKLRNRSISIRFRFVAEHIFDF